MEDSREDLRETLNETVELTRENIAAVAAEVQGLTKRTSDRAKIMKRKRKSKGRNRQTMKETLISNVGRIQTTKIGRTMNPV